MWRFPRVGRTASHSRVLAPTTLWIITIIVAVTSNAAIGSDSCGISARYHVVMLPFFPSGINRNGEVVGTTESHQAATWSVGSGLKLIPKPSGFQNTEGVDIDNQGHALVMAYDSTFTMHQAYVSHPGGLEQLPGEQVRAFHINDKGFVAGEALIPGTQSTGPAYWQHGYLHRIPACCGGSVRDINQNGMAVGYLYDEDGRYSAYSWTAQDEVARVGPEAPYSSAIAVDKFNHVLITSLDGDYLLEPTGRLIRLPLSTKFRAHPTAMSACGAIVGGLGPFSDKYRAFAYEYSSGLVDLNNTIPGDEGWLLKIATAVNDRGQIVGRGIHRRNGSTVRGPDDDQGFLLTPLH